MAAMLRDKMWSGTGFTAVDQRGHTRGHRNSVGRYTSDTASGSPLCQRATMCSEPNETRRSQVRVNDGEARLRLLGGACGNPDATTWARNYYWDDGKRRLTFGDAEATRAGTVIAGTVIRSNVPSQRKDVEMTNGGFRWNRSAYPFAVIERPDDKSSFESRVLVSSDGWIEIRLTRGGWYEQVQSSDGGVVREGYRRIIQVARDSQAIDDVIRLSAAACEGGWLGVEAEGVMREQLAITRRARDAGDL